MFFLAHEFFRVMQIGALDYPVFYCSRMGAKEITKKRQKIFNFGLFVPKVN